MDDITRQLLAVQEKDLRIANLQQMIAAVPAAKEKIANEMEGAAEGVDQAKLALQQYQSRINDLDSNIQACQDRIIQLQNKSREVKKNEEYRAILSEVDGQKKQISKHEDAQLELMEEVESAKVALAKAGKSKVASDARVKAAQADLDVREKNCAEQITKIREERDGMTGEIPIDVLRRYERTIAQPTAHLMFRKAIVPVDNGGCGYCHLKIPPDLQLKAKATNDATCGNCGSLLYWPE